MLIVIDMQKDFIDGVFGTKEAQEIVPKVADFVYNYKGEIYFTRDTHHKENKKTVEELILPEHCIEDEDGWYMPSEIQLAMKRASHRGTVAIYSKYTFGCESMCKDLKGEKEIFICGLCTDICVISNALMIRSMNPFAKITVISDLCAGTTPENHQKALDIMKMNLIEIKTMEELK